MDVRPKNEGVPAPVPSMAIPPAPSWGRRDGSELSPSPASSAAERAPLDPSLEDRRSSQDSLELSPEARSWIRGLSDKEKAMVRELKQRDQEVRQHEAAHKAAAGPYARGGPTFRYQSGPDGRQYAVGGEVQLDVSPVPGEPEATIQKMETIRRAALAPRDPSSQDRQVAAQATKTETQARQQVNQEKEPNRQSEAPALRIDTFA